MFVGIVWLIGTLDEMILDFSEAQAKIKEDENARRVEEGLTVGLTQQVRTQITTVACN